jgi:hypothetical protein
MYFGLRQIAARRPACSSIDTFCSGTGILKKERDQNQKRKAKVSRRPGLSSSSPAGSGKKVFLFLIDFYGKNFFIGKPDIPSRLPC